MNNVLNQSAMKKIVLTTVLLSIGLLAWSQSKKEPQENPKQEQNSGQARKAAENDFQNQKAQEAKDKQEAKRKAMKERAKSKQEIEKSQ